MKQIPVISKTGKPLMPTKRFGMVKRWIKNGEAKIVHIHGEPVVQMLRETKEYTQDYKLGVDEGSKYVGLTVANHKNEIIDSETVVLRDNVKKLSEARRGHRRARRCRLRKRPVRFLNRKNSKKSGRVSNTIKCKVDEVISEIEHLRRLYPIKEENMTFEIAQFVEAFDKMRPEVINIDGVDYEFSNNRAKAKARDKYTCQHCGKQHCLVEAHHIIPRSQGGSDDLENLITLCTDCHISLHKGEWSMSGNYKLNPFKYATQSTQMVRLLREAYPKAAETYGYVTKALRDYYGLGKDHWVDGVVIACRGEKPVIPEGHKNKIVTRVKRNERVLQRERGSLRAREVKKSNERKPSKRTTVDLFYASKDKKNKVLERKEKHDNRAVDLLYRGERLGFNKWDKVRYKGRTFYIKSMQDTRSNLCNGFGEIVDCRSFGGKKYVPLKELTKVYSCQSRIYEYVS